MSGPANDNRGLIEIFITHRQIMGMNSFAQACYARRRVCIHAPHRWNIYREASVDRPAVRLRFVHETHAMLQSGHE